MLVAIADREAVCCACFPERRGAENLSYLKPGDYSLAERKAAYHHLQAASNRNKDKEEAKADKLRALRVWDSFGVPKLMCMEFVDVIPEGDNWEAMKSGEKSP